jgi:hypothetical protein
VRKILHVETFCFLRTGDWSSKEEKFWGSHYWRLSRLKIRKTLTEKRTRVFHLPDHLTKQLMIRLGQTKKLIEFQHQSFFRGLFPCHHHQVIFFRSLKCINVSSRPGVHSRSSCFVHDLKGKYCFITESRVHTLAKTENNLETFYFTDFSTMR